MYRTEQNLIVERNEGKKKKEKKLNRTTYTIKYTTYRIVSLLSSCDGFESTVSYLRLEANLPVARRRMKNQRALNTHTQRYKNQRNRRNRKK